MSRVPYAFTRGELVRLLHEYGRIPRCRVCEKEIEIGEVVTHARHGNYRHFYHGESLPREENGRGARANVH